MHRRNAAERAIRTFKDHFIAGLCSTDKLFLMQLWDRLIEQATITLNLLRQSRLNPKLSAYNHIYGTFDFNRTPMAPPGTKVILHQKPGQRRTWSPRGIDGWYLGPALDHYRCYRIYCTTTNSERTGNTIEFFHNTTPMPRLSSADKAMQAANELADALQNPAPAAPFAPFGNAQLDALHKLSTLFQAAVNRTTKAAPGVRKHVTKHVANAVIDPDNGQALEYQDLLRHPKYKEAWTKSAAREFGRCAQGLTSENLEGTNTIFFIPFKKVPPNRKCTYMRFVCTERPQKTEVNSTRMTAGGNLIDYPGDVSTRTADLTTSKIVWDDTLSTPHAKYMCIDVKNFYLNTPMTRYEYAKIPLRLIPQEVIEQYDLQSIAHNGYVYVKIRQGMYGLPQAGKLANDLLAKRLATHGYYECRHTHGLWRHKTRPIIFTLVVDAFGVKYVGREHAEHLYQAIRQYYECSADWEGKLYCGVTLNWNYKDRTLDTSMPGYVKASLFKFNHPAPKRPQDSPYPAAPIQYGKMQMTHPDLTTPLPTIRNQRVRKVIGTFLFYARAIDSTMQAALSSLASEQSNSTEQTERKITQFLDYCATHPDATIRYFASDMILKIHSDASYLSEQDARSRTGGHFYLGNKPDKPEINNGALLNKSEIQKHVMSSAAESEVGAAFANAKEGTALRTTLAEIGRPQPPTPLQVDNSTAEGIANSNIKQKRSKAMDMRFYWLQDRVNQQQFHVYWAPGSTNLADYFSKHHPAFHHRNMRYYYLYSTTKTPKHLNQQSMKTLRGCADPASPRVDATSGFRVPISSLKGAPARHASQA